MEPYHTYRITETVDTLRQTIRDGLIIGDLNEFWKEVDMKRANPYACETTS